MRVTNVSVVHPNPFKANRRRAGVSAVLIFAMLALLIPVRSPAADAQQLTPPGLVVVASTQSFEATWTTLLDALNANPNIRVLGQVDHAAAAKAQGLSLAPNRVVFFGNPRLGSPLMAASRSAGLDLPQKIQVFESQGSVWLTFNSTSYLSSRHATGDVATLATINGALRSFASAATKTINGVPSVGGVSAGAGIVTTTSPNDFETTWSQLTAAIERSPANIAFTVDHGANSGGTLSPTRLVVFGNPGIGTPIMAAAPMAGIDLPLKMLVWEDSAGATHVTATEPTFIQRRHGFGPVASVGAASSAIANFTAAATAPESTSAQQGDDDVLGVTVLAFTGNEAAVPVIGAGMLLLGCTLVVGSRRRRVS